VRKEFSYLDAVKGASPEREIPSAKELAKAALPDEGTAAPVDVVSGAVVEDSPFGADSPFGEDSPFAVEDDDIRESELPLPEMIALPASKANSDSKANTSWNLDAPAFTPKLEPQEINKYLPPTGVETPPAPWVLPQTAWAEKQGWHAWGDETFDPIQIDPWEREWSSVTMGAQFLVAKSYEKPRRPSGNSMAEHDEAADSTTESTTSTASRRSKKEEEKPEKDGKRRDVLSMPPGIGPPPPAPPGLASIRSGGGTAVHATR
jgi:hypothetical protein